MKFKIFIFFILILCCSIFVSAVTPTMVSSEILPTKPTTTLDLLGYCQASDTDNDVLNYNYRWWKGDTLIDSGHVSNIYPEPAVSFNTIFNEADVYQPVVFESSDNKLVIAYNDDSNGDYGTFAFCDLDGTNCNKKAFNDVRTIYISAIELSSGNLAVAYRDIDNDHGKIAICDSVGENCVNQIFDANDSSYISLIEMSNGNLAVAYNNNTSDNGMLAVCNSTGESCSYKKLTDDNAFYILLRQLSNGNLAVAYSDYNNLGYGTYAVCDINLNTCTDNIFYNDNPSSFGFIQLSNENLVFAYSDKNNLDYGTLHITNNIITYFESSVKYLISTLDSSYTEYKESWIFSCLVNDENENSTWLNSSITKIQYGQEDIVSGIRETLNTTFIAFGLMALFAIVGSALILVGIFSQDGSSITLLTAGVSFISLAVILFVGYIVLGNVGSGLINAL